MGDLSPEQPVSHSISPAWENELLQQQKKTGTRLTTQ
jgi:hypothetical protein